MNDAVKSAARVIEVLQYFVRRKAPATLAVLASELGWPRSSAFALLKTLESQGYLYLVGEDHGYYPTPKWWSDAQVLQAHDPIVHRIRPLLGELAERSGETAMLAKISALDVIYLDVVEPPRTIRFAAHVGQLKPLRRTASGRALVSHLQGERRRQLYERLGCAELPDSAVLDRSVQEGVDRGWHEARGEYQSGAISVAAGFTRFEEPYAIVIAAPADRASDKLAELGVLVLEAAQKCQKEK